MMMKDLQEKLNVLFAANKHIILTDTSIVNIFCDNKTFTDNTLIVLNYVPTLLHYLYSATQTFIKYRLSFYLSNSD